MKTKIVFWVLSIVITILTAYYQRVTGPTYPKKFKAHIENEDFIFTLPRSQNGIKDRKVEIILSDPLITGQIVYRRYPTQDPFDTLTLNREGEKLIGWLPKQAAAGKLEYKIDLFYNNSPVEIYENQFIIIRFKANVPALILIPHILFIFSAMLLSTLSAFYAVAGIKEFRTYAGLTLLFFLIGGMIMGPIVQKFAFGSYWTGFPFGKDLTDNKALIGFIAWICAWIFNLRKERKYLVIIAAIVVLAISYIPHSARGSQLDYKSGTIKTGKTGTIK